MAKPNLTAQRLRELLHYDPETGWFHWLKDTGNGHTMQGDPAGWLDNGYINIEIDGERHKAHRLAWLYVYGGWPDGFLDHINFTRCDNRIENLRTVTPAENIQNREIGRDNKSGIKGVHWDRRVNKWRAQIRHQGKQYHLGLFSALADAAAAYAKSAAIHHTCNPSAKQAQQTT